MALTYSFQLLDIYNNRIEQAFKISKLFQHPNPSPMHSKKQRNNHSNGSRKQQTATNLIAPLGKQFQLLYRTCDKLPSSQQYQSVFFLKRKKITADEAPPAHDKRSRKKKQSSKKKKIEEKLYIDQVCSPADKRNLSLAVTKSTMPSSTNGMFKKSTFTDTFREKIDLEKSSIRKVNNLNNSNSSRYLPSKYLNKEEKSPKKKSIIPKSPTKNRVNSPPSHQQISIKSLQSQNASHNAKNSHKLPKKPKNGAKVNQNEPKSGKKVREVVKIGKRNDSIKQNCNDDNQYVFIDGQYLPMEDAHSSTLLTQKIISIHRPQKAHADPKQTNQFLQGFTKLSINLDKIKNKEPVPIRQMPSYELSQQEQEQGQVEGEHDDEESITESEKVEAERDVLRKIVFIQRWWRYQMERKAVEECNNVRHFPSNVESEKSIHNLSQQQQEQQEGEKEQKEKQDVREDKSLTRQKSERMMLDFIQMRQKLIASHIQSQKQILNRMLELKKIDGDKYVASLMEIQNNFESQMAQIGKLKKKMLAENDRMEELKVKLREKSEIMDKLEKLPANVVLEHFIEKSTQPEHQSLQKQEHPPRITVSNRKKSTGCHYSELSQENSSIPVSYRKSKPAQHKPFEINSPLEVPPESEKFTNSDQQQDEDQQQEGDNEEQVNEQDCAKLEQILEGAIDRQIAQAQIQKRYASQLGMGFQHSGYNRHGISTSVLATHNFIVNFLKFYEYFYKDQFLKLINLPYGHNQRSRIKINQGYTPETWSLNSSQKTQPEDDQLFFKIQSIIGQQILQDFHDHNYQLPEDVDEATRAVIYYQKVHHRAIIDCFNEGLNCFRPYYFINGAPYIWNYSQKALTFYYIAQDNVQEVFQKTQYKVLKIASSLCGILAQPLISTPEITNQMTLQQKLGKYREAVDPMLTQNREEKLGRVEKLEIQEFNYKWEYFQEEKTWAMFAVAQLIYEDLVREVLEIRPLGQKAENIEGQWVSTEDSCYSEQTGKSCSEVSQQNANGSEKSSDGTQKSMSQQPEQQTYKSIESQGQQNAQVESQEQDEQQQDEEGQEQGQQNQEQEEQQQQQQQYQEQNYNRSQGQEQDQDENQS